MEAAVPVRRLQAAAQTDAGLVADDDAPQQILHTEIKVLADRQRSRHYRRAQMDRTEAVAVVDIEDVGAHPVHQHRVLQRCLPAEAHDCGAFALGH